MSESPFVDGRPPTRVPNRPGEVHHPRPRDTELNEAIDRLERALNSTEASDQTRIAALTAIVNGHAALVAADPNQRGRR